ncbi:hypothetical protein GCM10009817_31570 [Terrabacter lapilli]|uniref:Uncharacterized protein n=1 Tax=Terrabacter lapilli TaxID=436231 RepID=A0ABN2SJ75_9MICO
MAGACTAVGLTSAERAVFRRAVEAVIWGMPAFDHRLMYEASRRAGGPADNQIVVWPGLAEEQSREHRQADPHGKEPVERREPRRHRIRSARAGGDVG